METNTCNVNQLDGDAHLPPRKRLLAGLKRQISDVNFPVPLNTTSAGRENDVHLNNSLRSQLRNPNLSDEEVVEASKIAATKAAKVAEAARANAEEKAAKAAKAVAAAKSALDLVATLSGETANKEILLKKNKMKKHVTVEALYNKNKGNTNCRTDEELARKLHQAINSSPRILRNSSGSDVKNHKHKRLKSSAFSERTSSCSGVLVGEGGNRPLAATNNGNVVLGKETEGPIKKVDMILVDLNTSKPENGNQQKLDNGEGCRSSKTEHLNSENCEVLDSFGRKRGRIKQKKLPLSICSFRDQSSPKEELKHKSSQLLEDNTVRSGVDNRPSRSTGPSGNSLMPHVEKTSTWKCQSFKTATCVKQNKVMQS